MSDDGVLCDVCREREAKSVMPSVFGATTIAYCDKCLIAMREPYDVMVAGLYGVKSMEEISEWAKPYIEATLEYYGKTSDDMLADIARFTEQYDNFIIEEGAQDG